MIQFFLSKTYHFSLVTEKRQFFVLLVAEDLNEPFSTENGCRFTSEPFLYHLTAVERFLIFNLISRVHVVFYTSPDLALFQLFFCCDFALVLVLALALLRMPMLALALLRKPVLALT